MIHSRYNKSLIHTLSVDKHGKIGIIICIISRGICAESKISRHISLKFDCICTVIKEHTGIRILHSSDKSEILSVGYASEVIRLCLKSGRCLGFTGDRIGLLFGCLLCLLLALRLGFCLFFRLTLALGLIRNVYLKGVVSRVTLRIKLALRLGFLIKLGLYLFLIIVFILVLLRSCAFYLSRTANERKESSHAQKNTDYCQKSLFHKNSFIYQYLCKNSHTY